MCILVKHIAVVGILFECWSAPTTADHHGHVTVNGRNVLGIVIEGSLITLLQAEGLHNTFGKLRQNHRIFLKGILPPELSS